MFPKISHTAQVGLWECPLSLVLTCNQQGPFLIGEKKVTVADENAVWCKPDIHTALSINAKSSVSVTAPIC